MTTTTPTPVRTAVELRPLPGGRTLLTTPGSRHFTLGTSAGDALRLLDAAAHPERASVALPDGWPEAARAIAGLLERVGTERADGADESPADVASAEVPVRLPDGERWVLYGDAGVVAALVAAVDPADLGGPDPRVETATGALHEAVHRAFARGAVLLVAQRGHSATTFVAADRACADARVPWVPVVLERSRVEAGPWVTPGVGASYEDYLARRIAAGPDDETERALVTPSLTGDCGADPEALPAAFATVAALLVGDARVRGGDTVVATGPGAPDVEHHPVLPLPGPRRHHRDRAPSDLADPLTGIVTRVRSITHHPSVPASLATVQADVCTMRRVSRWANSTSCQGSAFGDPASARAAALGEAVERYCGNMLDTLPVEHGSWTELSRRPVGRVLHPDDLVLYSDAQHAAPGFPFVRLTPDLPVHWVPGRSLTHDEPVWVPASLVYVNWFTAGYSAAPVTNFCPFAGIAAGPTWEYAVTSALEEVVERHATMVWWLNGQPLDAVDPGPELSALWDDVRGHGQRPGLVALDNEFGIPVAAGVLWNDHDDLLNIGFSARADLRSAALKAWTESLTLQEGSRDLLARDGRHWGAMRRGALNGRSFKPWRADRRYLDDFRADMHDCDDLMVQQQVHLDPRSLDRVRPIVDTPVRRTLDDVPSLPARSLEHYLDRVHALGHEVVVVDITSADVAATGLRVVRVVVPGTVGNAPAAFPFLGKGRVQDLAVELGWRERALAEDELNVFPLPHA
ncbi:YcaO-like family protein [Cellulosimicrobium marinum]|uniref:YcaO-like family protein n=1 Tax=Cellulosimicrobium marinum TaxID=1638992 RepID=UPI001E40454F|nr:YcaO-like family protein [Cellulosimicrobium marinum]MCB7135622.1 YcaO-like family protein [Cellulosimicrobium marinum]